MISVGQFKNRKAILTVCIKNFKDIPSLWSNNSSAGTQENHLEAAKDLYTRMLASAIHIMAAIIINPIYQALYVPGPILIFSNYLAI